MGFNSLSIKAKLTLGFTLITLLSITITSYSIVKYKQNTTLLEKMFKHPYTVSNAVKNVYIDILAMHLLLHSTLDGASKENLNTSKKKIYAYNKKIRQNFKIILEKYLGSKNDLKEILDHYQTFYFIHVDILEILNKNENENETKKINILIDQENIAMHTIDRKIDILSKFADNKAHEFFENAHNNEKITILYLVLFLCIAVLLSIVITFYTIRSIVKPIDDLVDATDKIINGKILLHNVQISTDINFEKNEIGKLFHSFNTLMSHLLLPYKDILQTHGALAERTHEVQRLLYSFDSYVIASKTDLNGKIIYASKAFLVNSGYTKEELLGKSHKLTHHPDMPKEVFKKLWATIKSGATWNGELKNKRKDGTFFWINSVISPDINTSGDIIGYNAISENITSKKAYEALSQTLENRVNNEMKKNDEKTTHMIQQSRLAQMGEMISMIAHQWRQPLASISAISNTLMLDIIMQNYKEEFFAERLESIGELSQHLSSTIDDFRNFFKDNKNIEDASLAYVINECLEIISSSLEHADINIRVDVDEEIMVHTYLNEFKQVILNILKNAEDIFIDKKIDKAQISIKAYEKDSMLYLFIEDNAGGIPTDIIDKVFDPYFSTKKQKDGTGLGLYMSKTIIEEHCEGKIIVLNTDLGVSFNIELPSITKESKS